MKRVAPRSLGFRAVWRDTLGREIGAPAGHGTFVDLRADANWAHPCRYVVVDTHGHVHVIDWDMPPEGD